MFRTAWTSGPHWRSSTLNHLAIVAQLLGDDRLDCNLKDFRNWAPLKLAIVRGHDECVKILREWSPE